MRVLILGGGGPLGAFSAGALRALEEIDWRPEAFIGSSAGGINLLRSLVGGAEAAADFWRSLDWKTLLWEGVRHNVWSRGLLDPEAFHARVDAGVDYEALWRDRRAVGFIVVSLATGKVSVRGNRTEASAEALRTMAHASYSLPPLLPPVESSGELLADGGLLQNAPLEAALKAGATEIVYLCNVQALPREGPSPRSTLSATARYAEIFFRRASNVGFADAELVEGKFRGVPFLTIAPSPTINLGSPFRWLFPTRSSMTRLIETGYERARSAIHQSPWVTGRAPPPEQTVRHAPPSG
ncbi:MAG TPA: patatin-like phospholipase family protein [Polyangiaceae bacterium]|nr:patatin-like phospholipase family protein [Polyangiaceae bacterium]